jgi:hypothetical protein
MATSPFGRAERQHPRLSGVALSSRYVRTASQCLRRMNFENKICLISRSAKMALFEFFSAITRLGPSGDSDQRQFIWDYFLVRGTRQFLALVETVSNDIDYLGPWGLGIAATGLRGKTASAGSNRWFPPSFASDEDTYRRVTMASASELRQRPGAVTERLVGRLLRVLSCSERYMEALVDPDVDGEELDPSIDDESGE